ncbi:MAG: TniB family NTP-binding protein [Opitutaceae bacterium]|jgi:hypothetical protein
MSTSIQLNALKNMNDDSSTQRPEESPETKQQRHLESLRSEASACINALKEERIELVFRDKHILYPEIKEVLSTLKDALNRPKSERPPGFALVGPSETGKTSLINRFGRDLGGDPSKRVGVHPSVPLLISKMPPRADEARIALMLARTMAIPVVYGGKAREVSDLVIRQLILKNVRMIIFHEFNNVKPVSFQEREVVYHFIKDLNNEGIVVVVVGTEASIALIEEDEELVTRLRPLRLNGFALDSNFASFVATLETYYPLSQPSNLPQFCREIHRRTFGVVGEVVTLLNEAAAWAIRNERPFINCDALQNCRYIPPASPPPGSKS